MMCSIVRQRHSGFGWRGSFVLCAGNVKRVWIKGERVATFVVVDNVASVNEQKETEEILERCRNTVSTYKCPSEIHFVLDLPTGATGKIQRSHLKERALS